MAFQVWATVFCLRLFFLKKFGYSGFFSFHVSFRTNFPHICQKTLWTGWCDSSSSILLVLQAWRLGFGPTAPTSTPHRCDDQFITPALGRQRQESPQSRLADQTNCFMRVWDQVRDSAWIEELDSDWPPFLCAPNKCTCLCTREKTYPQRPTPITEKGRWAFCSYSTKVSCLSSPVMIALLASLIHNASHAQFISSTH